MSSRMYSRFRRPFSLPRRRRRWLGGGRSSRYSSNYSSFDPWSSRRWSYGNSRRAAARRRRSFWLRDRYWLPERYRAEVTEEEDPKPPEPPTDEVLKVIHVKDVDFHIAENTKKHRTDKYDKTENRTSESGLDETGELVVRRGQEFKITLNLSRPYEKDKDDLRLIFQIGREPRATKGTRVSIKVNETCKPSTRDPREWSSSILGISGNDVTLSVFPAVNCIIGEWDFLVETVLQQEGEKPKIYEYDEPDNVYILLNPFCKDDTVYMSTQGLLDEYILNDQGCQWRGDYRNIGCKPWVFGQFEDDILDVSLLLLRKGFGGEVTKDMGNPVKISRMLSKMVNANDDDGLLYGKWGGGYSDGTSPSLWVGSVAILREYWRTRKPVKFGQCWVFSGVLTTVCRALGLPCRSVTNFVSAHDVDADAVIDKFFKMDGSTRSAETGYTNDSIWNYHVWNEAWFSRPDLPKGYDGWQAIDATPQETSEDVYQCGPCPVTAIHQGHLSIQYDATFIFGEVNCNVMYYEVGEYDPVLVEVDRKKVGKSISTKKPTGRPVEKKGLFDKDHPDRLDITHEYKPLDGSAEEKRVLETAAGFLDNPALIDVGEKKIVAAVEDIETVIVGSDFEINCTLKNPSYITWTVKATMGLSAVRYTGEELGRALSQTFDGEIRAGETKKLSMKVKVDDYLDQLDGEDSMRIDFTGKVSETGESFVAEDTFVFNHPEIEITFPGKGPFKVGEPFEVALAVNNPLNRPLTGLKLLVEGPGIRAIGKKIVLKQTTIPAKGKFEETIKLTPKKAGRRAIAVSLDSKELPDITGEADVEITK